MKTMKKLFALLLALTMVFGLAATGFAADTASSENVSKGTIQILNPQFNTTYNAYRLLDLESWANDDENGEVNLDDPANHTDDRDGQYSYKLNATWCGFFGYKQENGKFVKDEDSTEYGKDFITEIDDAGVGYVTWNDAKDNDIATFAQKAMDYATTNSIAAEATLTTPTKENAETTDKGTDGKLVAMYLKKDSNNQLDLGYYLVDTTQGALCSLGTTDKNAEIEEKNGEPTVDKVVSDDDGTTDGKDNDVNIGDTVHFTATIIAQAGVDAYVLHDTMDKGLTFDKIDSVTIDHVAEGVADDTVYASTDSTYAGDLKYTLTANAEHGVGTEKITHTFDMSFSDEVLEKLAPGDKIIVKYDATLNQNAVIGDDGNKNSIVLEYGDGNYTEPSETTTHTWQFNVLKFFYGGSEGKEQIGLGGAKFKLGTKYEEGAVSEFVNFVPYIRVDTHPAGYDANTDYYKVCTLNDSTAPHTHQNEITTNENGKFNIDGLDEGDYYLYETKAPEGFNKLSHPIKVHISNEGVATYYAMVKGENGEFNWQATASTTVSNQIPVENNTGTELPSTGGMGTTLFYVVGSLMVLGAAVLLVAKKRSNT